MGMPTFDLDSLKLYFETSGDPDGAPVLLLAPGGMRSTLQRWPQVIPWDPIAHLRTYRVIAMDQRNAGQSVAPVSADDGWDTYTRDQIALLDHLGVEQVHLVGMCIGGPFIMGLIRHAPDRVRSAVMFQPIGLDNNRHTFYQLFDNWAKEIGANHPEAGPADWAAFRHNMFGGDFLFNASRDAVASCQTPFLLFQGQDIYHPPSISDAFAELAPTVEYVTAWKAPEHREAVDHRIQTFLDAHTP